MGVMKTSDQIQIQIKMPNPSQKLPVSSKEVLKDMDVICTLKFKIKSQNVEHEWTKVQWLYPKQNQDAKPQSPSSKAPNQDLKDIDVFCTFNIKIGSENKDHRCIKDQWPYLNQDQDSKLQSGTPSVLQSPKWGLKGHGCSLHLQNQDRETKFWSLIYQRPVIISKSRSICRTSVRNLQRHQKDKIRT